MKKLSLSEFNTFISSLEKENFNFLINSQQFIGVYSSIHSIPDSKIYEIHSSSFNENINNIENTILDKKADDKIKNIIYISDIQNIKGENLLILTRLLKHNKINNLKLSNTIFLANITNETFNSLPLSFNNLFIILEIGLIFIEWIEYARIKNFDWRIISFLKENNNFLLFDNKNEENKNIQNYPSPYTWGKLSTLIKSNQNINNIDLFSNLVNGSIGEKTGNLFLKHIEKLEGIYFFDNIFTEDLESIHIIEEHQITDFYLASNFYFNKNIKTLSANQVLSYFKYTDVLLKLYTDNNDIIFSIKSVLSIIKNETDNYLDIFSFIFESGVFVENDTILNTISNYMKK